MERGVSMKQMQESKRRRLDHENESLEINWILGNALSESEFFDKYWEKQPLHVSKCSPNKGHGNSSRFRGLFGKATLFDIAESENLKYGLHLNVVNCKDGQNKTVQHQENDPMTVNSLKEFVDKYTIQFFQPQRYIVKLREHMGKLEKQFSCLWGANIYMTPPSTQGLAPHYDDVEVFVLQTEGRKKWRVHKSGPGVYSYLSQEYSEDLSKQDVGELLMEVVLEPGDLLYLPRGTIHYAIAEHGTHSVHITMSTYQKNAYYNLMESSLTHILDAAASNNDEFLRGLPIQYLANNGTWNARGKPKSELCKTYAHLLRVIADQLEAGNVEEEESLTRAFHEAVDTYSEDFMVSRLCSRSKTQSVADMAKVLRNGGKVGLIDIHSFNIILCEPYNETEQAEGDDNTQESEDGDGIQEYGEMQENEDSSFPNDEIVVRIRHTQNNVDEHHMGGSIRSPDKFVQLSQDCIPFLQELFKAYPRGITVNPAWSQYAEALFQAGILHTLSANKSS